ncbi:MAG: lipopolysaccharide heptosyltransferase I [Acidobacteria bacterium SCN 69-37]|nr:MAG: lipopolysaccharide heptosyltransferase I [Acidobacteria bacterium SCN 69-37]
MTEPLGRLLVVRLGSLGDLVHTLPAVAAIRLVYPFAQIDWLVEAGHRELLDLVPVISSTIPLRKASGGGWLQALRELRARQYDVAIDFQGLVKSAALARLSGAARVIGFDRASAREGLAALFYTERVATGDAGHVIDKNLRLAARLGAPQHRREFPILPIPSAAFDELVAGGLQRFALLNCGAAWPNKRWPADRFGRLASWLRERYGLMSVALWGPGERELADEVVRHADGAAMAAPPTSLTDLVAIAAEAELMVSGDTGPTHIAAALGTPVVGLFGPTSPDRNGPWVDADVLVSRYDTCECHYQRECRHGHGEAWCLGTIGEDDVRDAVARRLAARDPGADPSEPQPDPMEPRPDPAEPRPDPMEPRTFRSGE